MKDPESTAAPGARGRMVGAFRIGAAAAVAAALSVFFFSPRFILWRLLGTPITPPELVRAGDALRQLEHPLLHLESRVNRVMEWRLLFPILGHVLRVPPTVYLALPHVGALLAICLVAGIVRRHGFGWLRVIACATILATSEWFFVSMGWLGYFDSWYILALLLVVFSRNQRVAIAAVLLGPWVDERFVLTLPLCLFLRARYLGDFASAEGRMSRRRLLELCLALLPWVLIRAAFYLAGRDTVPALIREELATAHASTLPLTYAAGLWEGARWGWLAIVAIITAQWRTAPRWCAGFILILALTMAVNLAVVEDLSRSASVAAPAVLLGLVLFRLPWRGASTGAVVAIAALNLVSPAEHISEEHRVLLRTFPTELNRNRDPLAVFNAKYFSDRGIACARDGQIELALQMFDAAIHLDPSLPDLWLNRGEMRAERGNFSGAAADVNEAVRRGGQGWPRLGEAREVLEKLQARLN